MEDSNLSPGAKAARYWFVDGIPDIVSGVGLAVWGLCLIWFAEPPRRLIALIGQAVFLTAYLGQRWISEIFKSRTTYPRTGYVRPPAARRQESARLITIGDGSTLPDENVSSFPGPTFVVLIVASALIAAIGIRWAVPAIMLGSALFLYLTSKESERPYDLRWALVLPVFSVPFVFFGIPTQALENVPELTGGIWLALQGAWHLRNYLEATANYRHA